MVLAPALLVALAASGVAAGGTPESEEGTVAPVVVTVYTDYV